MTGDPRDFVYKPPRIAGEVPADYDGPLFYRVRDRASPSTTFGFKRWSKSGIILRDRMANIGLYGTVGLMPGYVLDEEGKLLPEFAEPIQAEIDTRRTSADWELRTWPAFVSDRVKTIIEEFEPGKAVFIPIDATWPDGRIDRYHRPIWGNLTGYVAAEAPNWLTSSMSRDEEFRCVSKERTSGRHFIWTNSSLVLSEAIVKEFGDVLLRQQVLVPLGVE